VCLLSACSPPGSPDRLWVWTRPDGSEQLVGVAEGKQRFARPLLPAAGLLEAYHAGDDKVTAQICQVTRMLKCSPLR